MMMITETESKGRVLQGEQSAIYAEFLTPTAVLAVARGRMSRAVVQQLLDMLEAQIAKRVGFIHVFLDASEAAGIDADARALSEAWGKRFPGTMDSHILFRSKLLDLAISLLRLAVRNTDITSYSSEKSWEARVAQSAPGFTRKPVSAYFTAR